MPKNVTVVDSTEIFKYAKTKHGINWNPSNDLFFRTGVIRYRRNTDFCLYDDLPNESRFSTKEPDYEITPEIEQNIKSFQTSNKEVCELIESENYSRLTDIAVLIISQYAMENNLTEFMIDSSY